MFKLFLNYLNTNLMKQDRQEPNMQREPEYLLKVQANLSYPKSRADTKSSFIFGFGEDNQCLNKSQKTRFKCRSNSPAEGKLSSLRFQTQTTLCKSESCSSPRKIQLPSLSNQHFRKHQLQFEFDQEEPQSPQVQMLPLIDKQILQIQSKIGIKEKQALDQTKNLEQLRQKCIQNPHEQVECFPHIQQLLTKHLKILDEISGLLIQLQHKQDIRLEILQAQAIYEEKKITVPTNYSTRLQQLEKSMIRGILILEDNLQTQKFNLTLQYQDLQTEMVLKHLKEGDDSWTLIKSVKNGLDYQKIREKMYVHYEQTKKDISKREEQQKDELKGLKEELQNKQKELEEKLKEKQSLLKVQHRNQVSQLKKQYRKIDKQLGEKFMQKMKKIEEMVQRKTFTFKANIRDKIRIIQQKRRKVIEELKNHDCQEQ